MSESTEKPTLYLETTIVSYLVGRPSTHILVLTHQQLTQKWWAEKRDAFTIYVAPPVIDEIAAGDPGLAQKRLEVVKGLALFEATPRVEELTANYYAELKLPTRALRDAAHLAFATVYAVDYLLTWNCRHLASAVVRRRLRAFNDRRGLPTPVICTPEELFEDDVHD